MADRETEAHREEGGVQERQSMAKLVLVFGERDSGEQRKALACRDLFVISGGF